MTKFEELGIKQNVLDALRDMGFEKAFPIQEAAIPVLLTGRDVVGQAHTGTGKTGAYSISMLQEIKEGGGIQGLIVAPTRELAVQITEEVKKFAKYTKVRPVAIYGGQSMGVQLDALKRGAEILVATPGRLIDHIKRGSISIDRVTHLVLDEADTMLDMGFIDDIQFILDLTPDEKVMSLFSATMPIEILRLSEEYLKNPKQFLLDADDLSGEGIDQSYLVIRDREKMDYLVDFIKENGKGQTIVFCSTKYRTRDVARMLHKRNYGAVAIEGDMSQHRREQSMSRFRTAKAQILVATDVAARGIDVPRVALVVNYDVPNQEMIYFHRIGRTARAGAKGRAITLVSYSSVSEFDVIKRQIKAKVTYLNDEMGIVVKIPDPLKRESARRRGGPQRLGQRRQSRERSDPRDERRRSARRKSGAIRHGPGYYRGLKSRW
ncbi:superfamily II helicase [Cenarchaeum symbiosum A]|uniref:Superfamily II helicase n=1 Tax=Cenarchaeum symbiosum (strain A) TaxID=414004 RepID=A0RUV7_CENSY|nr:superfamily II helicase [Cenarchaeum symbiosum A]